MHIFNTKHPLLKGTSYSEIMKLARREYHSVQKLTPRRKTYVRSRYFGGDKIFIDQFWDHLKQKHRPDQIRRLRLYKCALDLLRNTYHEPIRRKNPNALGETVYRFYGQTRSGEVFVVQVKESDRTKRKDFMSVFPYTIRDK